MNRLEARRWGGMLHLAGRLAEQDLLRADVTIEDAANIRWVLASFDSFDALYSGRGMTTDDVARMLITMAERSLYPDPDSAAPA